MGLNDLVKETGATLDGERTAALYWLSAALTSARAHGLSILDGVYNNFRDLEGYARQCRHGRMLGFDGKTLIHPDQIAPTHEAFAPTAGELQRAREIVAAYDRAVGDGHGVVALDGDMIDAPVAERARELLKDDKRSVLHAE